MKQYKVKDPATGRTITMTGESVPSESDIKKAFETVYRKERISGYNPMTQRSARLATSRPNMLEATKEELAEPLWDKERSTLSNLVRANYRPLALGFKGSGAAEQTLESALTWPIVAAQRGKHPFQKEFYRIGERAVKGEEPTEIGDVFRNMGVPEPVSATLGFAGMLAIPGVWEFTKGMRPIRKTVTGATGKAASKVGKGAQHATMTGLARIDDEVVTYGQKTGFRFIKPWQGVREATEDINKVVDRVDDVAKRYKGKVQQAYDMTTFKHRGDRVPIYVDDMFKPGRKVAPYENTLNKMMSDNMVGFSDSGKLQVADIPGMDDVVQRILKLRNEMVNRGGTIDIAYLSKTRGELDSLIGRLKNEPRAQAYAVNLQNDIRKVIRKHPAMKAIDEEYRAMKLLLEGDPANKRVKGIFDLTESEKLKKVFDPREPDVQTLLDELGERTGTDLTTEVKDVIANQQFSELAPRAKVSLLGAGALLYLLLKNPWAVGVGIAASSPKIQGAIGRSLSSATQNISRAATTKGGKLVGRTAGIVQDLATLKMPQIAEMIKQRKK